MSKTEPWRVPQMPIAAPFIPLRSPGANQRMEFVCLSPHPIIVPTHWDSECSVPCLGEGKNCPYCRMKAAIRVLGFFAAVEGSRGSWCVPRLTHEATRLVLSWPGWERGLTARGRVLALGRFGTHKRAKLTATLGPIAHQDEQIPQPFDLSTYLEVLWAGAYRKLVLADQIRELRQGQGPDAEPEVPGAADQTT